jgi:hypothetical protein
MEPVQNTSCIAAGLIPFGNEFSVTACPCLWIAFARADTGVLGRKDWGNRWRGMGFCSFGNDFQIAQRQTGVRRGQAGGVRRMLVTWRVAAISQGFDDSFLLQKMDQGPAVLRP